MGSYIDYVTLKTVSPPNILTMLLICTQPYGDFYPSRVASSDNQKPEYFT